MAYKRDFNFDEGSLGRNLAVFDQDARDFLGRDLKVHETRGEATLKIRAPWRDRTGNARRGLWAHGTITPESYKLAMGHTAEYGVYLEEQNNGKNQVIMPVLLATARSFMRSLERMFAQMETKTGSINALIEPGISTRPGTSQNAKTRTTGSDSKPNLGTRDSAGRFVDQGKGYSKAAKAAKALAKKLVERNARRRERYAAKKAAGVTRTTRRG